MKTIRAFIERHPVLSYYALTFAISWVGVLLVIGGPGALPGTQEQLETLLPFVGLALLAGPSVAGILMTALIYGKAGFRDLFARMTRWRVGARWYALALLLAPLYMTAVLLALSLISPEVIPGILTTTDKASFLLFGIVAGLIVGIFEELGWTGFAVPTLLRLRYGVLTTGLFVGILWGAWHVLTNGLWPSSAYSGELSLSVFLPVYLFTFLVGQLPAFRVLMVWVYDRSGGSLLVAMLMHASLTASTLILGPPATGMALLTYVLAYAAAAWIVVAAVAVANGGHLTRQPPLRRRVA